MRRSTAAWQTYAKSVQLKQYLAASAKEMTPVRIDSGEVVDLMDVSRQLLSWHNVNPLMSSLRATTRGGIVSSLPVSKTMNAPARRRADATPLASALIESMRDIGYPLETALADIIDNAITAKATRVDVLSETSGEHPALAILDNGEA